MELGLSSEQYVAKQWNHNKLGISKLLPDRVRMRCLRPTDYIHPTDGPLAVR